MHKRHTRSNASPRGLNISITSFRGRGKTPKKASSNISVKTTSTTRAVRGSPTSPSVDFSEREFESFGEGNMSNENSLGETHTISISDTQEEQDNLGPMASVNNNVGESSPPSENNTNSNSNVNSLELLVVRLQQSMAASQNEFMREIRSLRDSISQPRPGTSSSFVGEEGNSGNRPQSVPNSIFETSTPKLKDWNVSYSGDGNVSDFLFKIDTLRERSQCPTEYLMDGFQTFLTDRAETWYWMYIKQYPRATYSQLKTALTREFGTLESDHEVILRISTRRQHSKESYDDFHSTIVQMNQRLRSPMSDIALIEIIKKNVNPDLKIMLFISEPRDLGGLRDLARKAEKVIHENKSSNPYLRISTMKLILRWRR